MLIDNLTAELILVMKARQNFIVRYSAAQEIIKAVCAALELDEKDVKSRNRSNDNAEARFIIFYLLKRYTDLGLKKIGKELGRHHTTVIYGLETYQKLIDTKDKSFLGKISKVQSVMPEMNFQTK